MPNNWKTYKLTELGTIARGKSKHRPRDASHLYGGKYPFIQTGDVKAANHKLYKYTQTYSESGLAQSKLWPKGTMCITIAANIAETSILTYQACFPDSIIGFIADEEKCDIDFIEFMMQYFKQEVQSHSIGSVQDNINLGTFNRLEFLVPPLPEQKAIANILSAIDDKIENNLATNKTLEDMAITLYKHWFVDFGPFQDGEFIDSELGLIPKGWEVKSLGELAVFRNGKGIKRIDRNENGAYKIYGSNGFIGYTDKIMFDNPVVAIGRVGANYGEIHYSIEPCWVSDNAITVQPKEKNCFWWLLQTLRIIDYSNFAGGSAQPLITQGAVKEYLISVPNEKTLVDFSNNLDKLFKNLNNNIKENQSLTQLRDTLLPKLISGEVRLKEFEEQVESVIVGEE